MAKKPVTLEAVDTKLKRWKTRFARAVTEIAKLEAQRRRLLRKAARTESPDKGLKPTPRPWAHADLADLPATLGPAIREASQEAALAKAEPVKEVSDISWSEMTGADLDPIPSFLRVDKKPDPVAEQIKTEQAETKKAKARGRIEKMKAVKRGDTKKMPLTGKAALDHIRNG